MYADRCEVSLQPTREVKQQLYVIGEENTNLTVHCNINKGRLQQTVTMYLNDKQVVAERKSSFLYKYTLPLGASHHFSKINCSVSQKYCKSQKGLKIFVTSE